MAAPASRLGSLCTVLNIVFTDVYVQPLPPFCHLVENKLTTFYSLSKRSKDENARKWKTYRKFEVFRARKRQELVINEDV